ncbi:MAG: chemotaxis protein CheC [Nitrospirota bacterium]|nr:chemotaxis protein CheC [Nitrospirota bacterium]
MSEQRLLTEKQLESFKVIANLGLQNATKALADMVNLKIVSENPVTNIIPFGQIPSLVGGEEEDAVGVYLQISGDISGHIMLLWDYAAALNLVDLLMENPSGTTTSMDDMAQSALKEVGNMVGSFFLNAMADFTGLKCTPSPPALVIDMMGSILNTLSAQVAMEGNQSLVIDTTFTEGSHSVLGNFMLIPSSSSTSTILARLESGAL